MTTEEAKKVLDILSNADGGCPVCVNELEKIFYKEFPQFKPKGWVAKDY